MFYWKKLFIHVFIIMMGFVFLAPLPYSFAQDVNSSSRAVRNEVSKTIDVEKKIQKRETAWTEESAKLSDQLARLEDTKKYLKRKFEKLTQLKVIEEKKYKENIRKKKEADRIRNELSFYLDTVLAKLESHINSSLPFLTAERHARIDSLKEMMVDPTESSAEKFRRIFEALQIEAEYGTTIEAIQKTIIFDGAEVLVDIFRLGRVSLFCQTIDRKKSGYFDVTEKRWKYLPENINRDLTKAIAMARLERSVELVNLPLGRIVQQ